MRVCSVMTPCYHELQADGTMWLWIQEDLSVNRSQVFALPCLLCHSITDVKRACRLSNLSLQLLSQPKELQ